jgi:hypothetical protein
MVTQFKDNLYSRQEYTRDGETFYSLRKKISQAEFNRTYRIPELRRAASQPNQLLLLRNELKSISAFPGITKFRLYEKLSPGSYNDSVADSVLTYLLGASAVFSLASNRANDAMDSFYNLNRNELDRLRDRYFNYKLEEIVTKYYERKKILFYNNTIVQNYDPVYLEPSPKGLYGFRTHFYSPAKYLLGIRIDTFIFNISLVLLSTLVLYIILYYELLARGVTWFERIRLRKESFRNLVN